MRIFIHSYNNVVTVICAALLAVLAPACADADGPDVVTKTVVTSQAQSDDAAKPELPALPEPQAITIQTVEPFGDGKQAKKVAWLGLSVEESSEALSSQLGLKPGEGLTVNYLAAGSPAVKADFHKNDVLVELDGQMLVHPMQLRKLLQMHAEGDTVKLTFYRGGKKQSISVKLGKMNWDETNNTDEWAAPNNFENLQHQFNGLNGQLRGMSESLARADMDKARVDTDFKRTMEQTRRAIQDAVRRASSDKNHLDDADWELERLARDGVNVDKDATIVVRNKRNSNRMMLQTDESGTYIIEAGAKTHLTARDKLGKLLFDGDIDTPDEREKVPKDIWAKAEPMFDQIASPNGGEPKKQENKAAE